ncbi:DUF1446 domain-containing protein [Eubacteriales bacterium OttesenSCG-928-K08]|nr:DUF1446 domain-containing protein [Eubacteriales bacterium OttesenSCG-928-K08]
MNSCKILMPTGGLGAGILQEAFDRGMALKPDVIAVDAGSTDSGPAYLANGMSKYARQASKHDLRITTIGAMTAGIPLFIGSCGTCGTDNMVDYYAEIVEEIFREEGFQGKIAKIYCQQSPDVLKQKWDEGKIHALDGAPDITRETFDECSNIVAVLGAEPFIEAYNQGANIVLAGRATDTAIMAALPLHKGCDVAAAWHGAKTVECGAQCADKSDGLGVFLTVDETGFYVKPLMPDAHCTPYTVSAHMLYENSDPHRLREPSGTLIARDAVYTQFDEQTTYVTGSKFEHATQYTMKLEGAAIMGYQNISLVGIANRKVLADPEKWIANISAHVDRYIKRAGINKEDYSFNFKAYGYNAVVEGPVPEGTPPPREIGMLLTVTAKTQELATQVAKIFNPYLLHFPADFNEQLPSFAFPFSPVDCPRGATYAFKLFHVVDVEDPLELVRIAYVDIDGREEK